MADASSVTTGLAALTATGWDAVEPSEGGRFGSVGVLTAAQTASVQSLVSGDWNRGLKPRSINTHDLRLTEPMVQLDLPSPSAGTFTGLTNKEHAYGTPIFFPNGWRSYRYWMVGAPYPTRVNGACTIRDRKSVV